MRAQSIVSPEDQKVTFVELFFDLVFVFSVTQIVGLLHDGFTWRVVGEAVLAFWLVWWAWTQFTWALNAADTTHPLVELGTLLATGVAFFMAIAVPDAFAGRAAWFAVPYVMVRVIGLGLYGWVAAAAHPSQFAAVCTFAGVSLGGLAAVIAGALFPDALYWLWGCAILLDVIAAAVGGRAESWNLHPEHFAERHGLFVIIALGESLIVVAGGATGALSSRGPIAVAVLAVIVTGALWWSYFTRAKPELDHALESCRGAVQSSMARDVFSLIHFAMLCGVIAYAAAVREAVTHPNVPLSLATRVALAAGLVLFVGGMAIAMLRANGRLLAVRLVLTTTTAVVLIAWRGIAPVMTLAIAFVGVATVGAWEHRAGKPDDGADATGQPERHLLSSPRT